MKTQNRSIAISTGHSRSHQGARNQYTGLSEWQLCNMFCYRLRQVLLLDGYAVVNIDNFTLGEKVKRINDEQVEVCIDVHLNVFDTNQDGHLCMYWKNSPLGKSLAQTINHNITHNKERELIPVNSAKEKGGYYLQRTKAIAVIMELGFIDNYIDMVRTVLAFHLIINETVISIDNFFNRYSIPETKGNEQNVV